MTVSDVEPGEVAPFYLSWRAIFSEATDAPKIP
jgi:hypothetical protein